MKKMFFAIMLGVCVALITACGSGASDNANKQTGSKESGDLWKSIQDKGVLTIGTEGTYAPFTFHDKKTDKLTGYDVEVITEVAKRLDLKPEFKETQWDSMFAGLNSKRFDVVANQVGKTGRENQYEFSDKYTTSQAIVVTKSDNNDIKKLSDVKGKKAAQSLTSNYNKLATDAGAKIEGVEGLAQSIQLIQQGRADLTFNDKLAVLNYLKTSGNKNLKVAFETGDPQETYFAFRKGSGEVVDKVNGALKEMKKDGTLAKISKKWFGEDVTK
ncbi:MULTISPECIES: cystine ABC transporter substrate-binding lipoprotein TcyA [Bacillus]|uniref:cystine ABC transporter substrate-binding lipoprotein TcyA n=1 Tax=Bacillus TaxID=1386 RepID=UPI0007763E29|nr:cystine ABC transporter substrate-binding lipoprotein TcyA [Bacillus pumilus]AMM96208.1 L-cystine-binding protein TcyA [Bacillus pumilus]MCY7680785.1 cystine ABC transporter substrate-binding lipoprotein TcyA [Bacillus pumilus]MCY9672182.1 cystine ABC transporter substrate-binding lipoprotein TcyA [Bacillus pumilus]MDH3150205.1 cystine ABC transporter substrate-binding lipoprotein TcyA [Bacillus pumilus]MEB2359371.1 cystine ABC transporter substrate-binding lipoprotein TcyA [Bacillus pumilu